MELIMLCSIRHSFYHIENQKPMLSNGNISIIKKNEILIEQSLDKFGNLKSIKGNKKTLFKAPKELINILTDWKIEQKSN